MSCQGTWVDAIIIQAVANCVKLSIRIAESNPTFSPVTVVESVNVTNALNIYIGHLAEFYYVSTVENITMEIRDKSKPKKLQLKTNQLMAVKHKACRRKYMRRQIS